MADPLKSKREQCRWLVPAWLAILVGSVTLPNSTSLGVEPAAEFLDKLRERGYFDMADAYLARVESNDLINPEFKLALDLEKGMTRVQLATRHSSAAKRLEELEEAKMLFRRFLADQPQHPRSTEARSWIGRIVLEQARLTAANIDAESDPTEQKRLRQTTAELLDEARRSFTDQVARLRGEIERLRKLPREQQDPTRRDQLRVEYLQASMATAEIEYEMAATLEGNERTAQLKQAAKSFEALTEKYRQKLVGLQAMILQGRCLQDIGDLETALALYQDFIGIESATGPLRKLSAQAVLYSMQCLSHQQLGKTDQAIELGRAWLDAAGGAGTESIEIQDIRLELAREMISKSQQSDRSEDSDRWINEARQQLFSVARIAGPRQSEARSLMAKLPGNLTVESTAAIPASFDEAKLAAEQARESMRASEIAAKLIERRIASTRSSADRDELSRELEKAVAEANLQRENSRRGYEQALKLAPTTLPIEEINRIRFFLAYLCFGAERYFDAATLGEFLAYRFPESEFARSAGNIAMASYLRIYGNGDNPQLASFSSKRVVQIADYLASTWPDQKEAQDALITLVSFMVSNGQLDQAQSYLARIPDDSPRRGEAELRTGQALWAHCAAETRIAHDHLERDASNLETWKARAEQLMATGIERMRNGDKSITLIQAVLSLAQLYVEVGKTEEAIELLRDPDLGPLTLLAAGSPWTTSPGFDAAAYKTALRAEFARMADPQSAKSARETARELMAKLEQAMGSSPAGRQRLVATYVSLAKEMQNQIDVAPPDTRRSLAEGFEVFLNQVRATSHQFNVLNWVAETYLRLGESLQLTDSRPSPQAMRYFGLANEVYQSILDGVERGKIEIADNHAIQVRIRRATTMARLGEFGRAIDEFETILKKNNNLLNLQIEAARVLQAGGEAGDGQLLREAVIGSRRNPNTGKNTIWGWSQIARIAQAQMRQGPEKKERYQSYFFDAQLHVARCRFEQARRATGDEATKYLSSAKRTVLFTAASYPLLGGEEPRQQFDQLLRQIQSALGEPASGLEGTSSTDPMGPSNND